MEDEVEEKVNQTEGERKMQNVNKIELLGNIGGDIELRYTGAGTAVCNLRVATNERWKGKDGQKKERTEWHRVVVWGKSAELCGEYLNKGDLVRIEGSNRTRKWEDKEGNTHYTTEVHARQVGFLSPRKKSKADAELEQSETLPSAEQEANEVFNHNYSDEDVPF